MSHTPPVEPLVVVLGSTGTGKSELAVELATRFRGEIINADAMQLYDGMPIITNKMTSDEQRGIPHHLLGHIALDQLPWAVDDYKREANKVIREIRSRGNLPILVGGTQYYVDPLLFKDVILDEVQFDKEQSFPILEEPTEILLQELKKVDPVMAERWHPKDRRKIQRSLEIYLQTGKPASEFYAEQQRRKAEAVQEQRKAEPWEKLLFWVYSEREVLKERLDKRIDKMLDAGLLAEVEELVAFKRAKTAEGQNLDMTKGIWQSIGYKQFEPFILASQQGGEASELAALKTTGLEDMKTATRRYANYQTKWIRLKQVPLLIEQGSDAMDSLYVLDSTDVSKYQDNVVVPAAHVLEQFLRGEARPEPVQVSELARRVLTQAGEPPPKETPCQKTCEVCQTVLVTEEAWSRHIKGAGHRRVMKRKKRLALVPVEQASEEARESDEGSGAELGTLFTAE
ncbi:IPP transferase-domain-containing protein [Stachybotrys elegans]|uniref:tRNA dimethylallyltransferase n=1 Tax=Stachybotrys elegans TaxID=80388 RepID=A0A8K0WRL2_9HYPO|nr:IPP transferase-domain-containing protein [Stachybotrys elegans]